MALTAGVVAGPVAGPDGVSALIGSPDDHSARTSSAVATASSVVVRLSVRPSLDSVAGPSTVPSATRIGTSSLVGSGEASVTSTS